MNKIEEKTPDEFLHYKVIEILGKGGNGTVFRVENTKTGQVLALKTLNSPTDVTLNRFKKEFFSLKKMDHPYIVKVFNAYFDHSPPFFTMEWVQGKTLGQIIADMKKNPLIFAYQDREDFACRVCLQLCDVLTYIHGFEEIHRDLKPENIFITQGEGTLLKGFSIKMLDFGLLKQLNSHQARNTKQGMVVGTVQFLSPEQAKGGQLDPRSDLFSVGIILYNMLSLDLPFQAKDLVAYLFQIVFEEPIPISRKVPEISSHMDGIITRLLDKDPSKRFPSALTLSRAIEACRANEPIHDVSAEDFIVAQAFEGFGDPLLPPCLVARDREIDQMLAAAHSHTSTIPMVLLVQGDAGLGKTFLINEWLAKLEFGQKTVLRLVFSSQVSPAQDPIGQLMDNLIRNMDQKEIQETFKDIYPFLTGVSRYLSRFFDMRSVGSLDHLSSGRKLQLIAQNFIKLIHKLSNKGPVIMVLENTHLAPESFFGWLTIFLEQVNAGRFMIVLSYTPDHQHPSLTNLISRIQTHLLHHHYDLLPLQQDDICTMLQSMIPVNKSLPFSPLFDDFISQNSGGNPHLAIELFTSLYDDEGLQIKQGLLSLKNLDNISLPQSIHQALMLKIQKLPPHAMTFVEAASVFGNEFEIRWLQGVLVWDEELFFSIFMELIRIGVFREEDEPVHIILFQNMDLRKLVYSSLSDERKTLLHHQAARSIELLYNSKREDPIEMTPERQGLYLEYLHLHFSRCRSFVQATKYAYFSGNLALEQKDTDKAISLFKECLKLMNFSKNKHTQNLVNLKLGEVFLADHQFEEAITYFLNSYKNPKISKIEELRIYKGLIQAYKGVGQYDKALNTSEKLVKLSQSCSPKVISDALVEKGLLYWESKGNGQALYEHVLQAETHSTSTSHHYYKTLSAFLSNHLKHAIAHIKDGKETDISPTPFLITLAALNYMSGQFNKGFTYLDSLKKGEKSHQIDPRFMVFKSLMTYLLKRKKDPDHGAGEYIDMATRYIDRFCLDKYRVYVDLFQLEELLLNEQSEEACKLIDKYRQGDMPLPKTFFERMMLIFLSLQAIWNQIEVPPRVWLDEFNSFELQEGHPLVLEFHYALAMNSNALLPLSGNIQAAIDSLRKTLKKLKKFNLKYYQGIIVRNQLALFEKLEEETLIQNLQNEYQKLLPFMKGHSLS